MMKLLLFLVVVLPALMGAQAGECDVAVADRKDCGYKGIPGIECRTKGCCYVEDHSNYDAYWCFYTKKSRTTATCELQVNSALDEADRQPISGNIQFSQDAPGGAVTIVVDVSGFTVPGSSHGFHVHVSSDFSNGCNSAGGHFNPAGNNHGAPGDAVRHVGDLGNIVADATGKVATTIVDNVIDFTGANDISGRAIVIHRDADDLGLGGYDDSLTTGHAGPRLACCTITVN